MRRTWMKCALLGLAPLLTAFHCKSIHPTFPTNPAPPGDFKAQQASVEPKLIEASANSVLALGFVGNWDILEPCNACFGTNCSFTAYPTGWPDNVGGRHTETVGSQSWRCNFNFKNLDDYLVVHSDPSPSRPTRRHFMVQLAPVFHTSKTTPPYLANVAFDNSTMKTKYRRFLDRALPILNNHVAGWGNPIVAVGLGNEINGYLNSQSNPTNAWAAYSNFVQDAMAHITATWPASTPLVKTVSTQYYGFCGLGDVLWSTGQCNNSALVDEALNLMAATDVLTFTYYPYPLNDSTTIASTVANDLYAMAAYANFYGMSAGIQEAGYPTTGTAGFPAPQSTQTTFVNALFANWANFSDYIIGVNYFTLTDFPQWAFKTGFFTETGAVKSTTAWNNFKTKMAGVH
jgi:hypothetical protein